MGIFSNPKGLEEPTCPLTPEDLKARKNTDSLCALLYNVFVIGFVAVGIWASTQGNIDLVTRGMDYRGAVCGTDLRFEDDGSSTTLAAEMGSHTVFAKAVEDHEVALVDDDGAINYYGNGATPTILCGATCFDATYADNDGRAAVCYKQGSGDDDTASIVFATAPTSNSLTDQIDYLTTNSGCQTGADPETGAADGIFVIADAHDLFGYCIPEDLTDDFGSKIKSLMGDNSWSQGMSSISNSWALMVGMCFFALAVAFIYLQLLRYVAKPAIWAALLAIAVAMPLSAGVLYTSAQELKEASPDTYSDDANWQMRMGGAVAITIAFVLYLLLLVFLRKRIALATRMIKLTGKFFMSAPLLPLVSLVAFIFTWGVLIIFGFSAVSLFSMADIKKADSDANLYGRTVEVDQNIQYLFLFQVFNTLWICAFAGAFVQMVVAFVVSHWFFAPKGADGKRQLVASPIKSALKATLGFHTGSLAFGALLLAIVRMIRLFIEYTQRVLQKQGGNNRAVKVVICMCRCCFWCLDKCLKFINKNAYIMVVLTRGGFLSSAKKGVSIVVANMARVGVLNIVGSGFMFIGKLLCAAVPAAVTYTVLTRTERYADVTSEHAVANPFVPAFIVFLVGYMVGSFFMSVWDVSTDTMLICFCYNERYQLIDDDDLTALNSLSADAKKAGLGKGESEQQHLAATPSAAGQSVDYS